MLFRQYQLSLSMKSKTLRCHMLPTSSASIILEYALLIEFVVVSIQSK